MQLPVKAPHHLCRFRQRHEGIQGKSDIAAFYHALAHQKHYGAVVTNQLFTVMGEDEFGGHGMLPCSVPGSISLSQSGAFGGAAGTGCPSCRLCSVAANRHAPI